MIVALNESKIRENLHALTQEEVTPIDVKKYRAGYKQALKDIADILKGYNGETPKTLRTIITNIRNDIRL